MFNVLPNTTKINALKFAEDFLNFAKVAKFVPNLVTLALPACLSRDHQNIILYFLQVMKDDCSWRAIEKGRKETSSNEVLS